MEKKELIFLIIVGICALLAIAIFITQMILFILHVRRTKISTLTTACAGSPIPRTPANIKIQDLRPNSFRTDTDEQIEFNNYQKFWVQGSSMLLCGIKNGDILFAKPIAPTAIANLSFGQPRVLILKREGQSLEEAIAQDDYARYKVRRTWAMMNFDEAKITAKIDEILQNEVFKRLKQDYPENFPTGEDMQSDFQKRLVKYRREYPNCENISNPDNRIIISTTLRNTGEKNIVCFSIHPARIIVGEAVYSFHKEENYPQLS